MKIRYLTLLLLATQVCIAQNFTVTQGKEFSVSDKQFDVIYIGSNADNYFILRHDRPANGNYRLCSMDQKTSSQKYDKAIKLAETETLLESFFMANKIILVTQLLDKATSKAVFLARTYYGATGESTGIPMGLEELNIPGNNAENIITSVKSSPDLKKLLIVISIKNEKSKMRIAQLYDPVSLTKIWGKVLVDKIENTSVIPLQYEVDNAGNFIYLVSYVRPGTKNDLAIAVGLSPASKGTTNFVKLPTENKTINTTNIQVHDNELICTGEFINGIEKSIYNVDYKDVGIYMFSVDLASGEIMAQNFDFLSADVQGKLFGNPELFLYRSYYIDKELYTVFQDFYSSNVYHTSKTNGFEEKDLRMVIDYGKQIMVVKYTSAKKTDWMRIIPRNTLGEALTMQVICTKNIHILYHDTEKNFNKYPDVNAFKFEKWKPTGGLGTGAIMACVTIDKTGNMTRVLAQSKEADQHLMYTEPFHFNPDNKIPLKLHFDKKAGTARIDLLKIED